MIESVVYDKDTRKCIETLEAYLTGLQLFEDVYCNRYEVGTVLNKEFCFNFNLIGSDGNNNSIEVQFHERKSKLNEIVFSSIMYRNDEEKMKKDVGEFKKRMREMYISSVSVMSSSSFFYSKSEIKIRRVSCEKFIDVVLGLYDLIKC